MRLAPSFLIGNYDRRGLSASACHLFIVHEQHRYAPNTGKGNNRIDYSCHDCGRAAADPCNQVEGEQTDESPVERTYYN